MRYLGENRCGLESAVGRYLNKARNVASDNIAAMTEDFQKKEAEYISKLDETTSMGKVMLFFRMLSLSSCTIFHILMNEIRGFKLKLGCTVNLSSMNYYYLCIYMNLQTKQDEVSDICMTQRTALTKESQRVEKEHAQLEDDFCKSISSLGEWSVNHNSQLEGLAMQVTNFVNQDMVKDISTGNYTFDAFAGYFVFYCISVIPKDTKC